MFLGLVNLGFAIQMYRDKASKPIIPITIIVALFLVPYLIIESANGDHYSNLDLNLNKTVTLILAFYIGIFVYLLSKRKKM